MSSLTITGVTRSFGTTRAVDDVTLAVPHGSFTTVLGPNYNSLHSNHFHLDLAHHGRDGLNRICK